MITLITICYSFLFSINPSVQPDCENKLKELNYAYEYNQEPAMANYDPEYSSRYSVHCISVDDSISPYVALEVKSMYNCFKLALDTDTNKVLLISYYSILEQQKINNQTPENHRFRHVSIDRLVDYHDLENHQIYYNVNFSKEQNTSSRYKIELLDRTHSKLTSENTSLWKDVIKCDTCPF